MRKLVRDHYLDIIPRNQLQHISDAEAVHYLTEKVQEELQEVIDSGYKDVMEYGDLLEVILRLAELNGFSKNDVLRARNKKSLEKGGFKKNLLWTGELND